MSALGSLVVSLSLEHAAFTKGLDKSSQQALTFAKKTQSSFDEFSKGVVSGAAKAVAAYATVNAAITLLKSSLNYADEINDVAKANQIAVGTILKLSQALTLNGGIAENSSKIFSAFTQSIDSAATGSVATQKRFASLNVTLADLANLDGQGLFDKTLQGLAAIEDPIKRNAAAMDLFGKAVKGVDISGVAEDYATNKANYDNAEKSFKDIGIAFDKIDKFSTNAKNSIAEKFGPALLQAVNFMEDSGPRIAAFLAKFNPVISLFSGLYNPSETQKFSQSASGQIKKRPDAPPIREVIDTAADEAAKKEADRIQKVKQQYADLIKSIKDKISAQKEETSLISQGVSVQDAETIAKYRALGVSDALVVSLLNAENAHKQVQDALKIDEEFYTEYEASIQKNIEAIDAQTESINQQAIDLIEQNANYGKLPSAITDVTIARLNDKKATLQGLGLEVADIEAQILAYEKLRTAQNNSEFLDTDKKRIDELKDKEQNAIKETADTAKRAAQDINSSLTDALLRGFESGKGFAQNFKATLINMFKTLVLKPVIELIVNSSGIGNILSSITGGAQGGTKVGGGLGVFDSIKNIFSAGNASIVNTIGSIGSSISAFGSTGTGFIKDIASKIGSFTQLNSGFISKALPYAGAVLQLAQGNIAGAALTAVGTFFGGPLGGAIGGAIGSLFGKKKKIPRFSTERAGVYDNGVFTGSSAGQQYKPLGAEKQLDGLGEQFSRSLGNLLKGFGLDDKISTEESLFKKRKASYGNFSASFAGGTVNAGTSGKAKNVQDTLARLVEKVLGETLVQAIQASKVSAGIKKFFDGMVDKAAVADAISTLVGLNGALRDLPSIFNAVRSAIDTTAYKTSIANLKALFDNTQTYVSLFYTDQEKFANFTKQIKGQFADLNTSLPATREGFRALVDGLKVVDAATSQQFAGLVALAPAADAYYKALQDATEATNALIASLKDESNFKTMFDFQRYQGLANNYGTAFAENRVPSYAVGTDYVPNDGLAMLHKGEKVTPAKFNNGNETGALVNEIRELRASMQQNTAQAKRAADVLVNITPNGNAIQTEVYVP